MNANSPFQPPWWLANAHLQTLFPTFHRKRWQVDTHRERLEMPDGDFIDLAWAEIPPTGCRTPIVVLFHGLEGSINSPYAKGMLKTLRSAGWYPVLMHFRGCSGEPNRLPRGYHSGETSDAFHLLSRLRRRFPQAPLAAVGYSLGGNMLLKLQGELGSDSPLSAAVSVCAPLRLDICADRISQGFSRIYQRHLLQRMKTNLLKKLTKVEYPNHPHLTPPAVEQLADFWAFDATFTAPIHGFRDVNDYYARSSARQYLKQIARPTLVIQAADDPFMTPDVLPSVEELSDAVELEISPAGGHVGFVTGSLRQPRYWLEQRVPAWLKDHLA